MKQNTYHITTFGCQANLADSERIAAEMESKGFKLAKTHKTADHVIINTCMVRQMAEDRVYGLYQNLIKQKAKTGKPSKIVVTGCMVGAAVRDPSGKYLQKIKKLMPQVDEFLPIEEVGFDHAPLRTDTNHAWVPISNGCNNYCTFCIVPYSRGPEVSRPIEDIIEECRHLAERGYTKITLLGQNVNSYGADLILGRDKISKLSKKSTPNYFHNDKKQKLSVENQQPKATLVHHLGRHRIPTLFPYLLKTICEKFPQFEYIDFISSNPWDFSDDLIQVMANNPQITRKLHLPVQSGSDRILKAMNRWYTSDQYLELIKRIRKQIPDIQFTTDIIVGFPGETDEDFQKTVELVKQVKFIKSYTARYSPRPNTQATNSLNDNVPHKVKKKRWQILDEMINQ